MSHEHRIPNDHSCDGDTNDCARCLGRQRDESRAEVARLTSELEQARAQALADRGFQTENARLRAAIVEFVASYGQDMNRQETARAALLRIAGETK